jgi:hypothetical protein
MRLFQELSYKEMFKKILPGWQTIFIMIVKNDIKLYKERMYETILYWVDDYLFNEH